MMTIILTACMISDPNVCKDHRMPVDGDMDVTQCAMHAPPYIAQWADQHPEWQFKSWKCMPGNLNDT
jgi:hypothetical protein